VGIDLGEGPRERGEFLGVELVNFHRGNASYLGEQRRGRDLKKKGERQQDYFNCRFGLSRPPIALLSLSVKDTSNNGGRHVKRAVR
jgi:hypothetical protein